MLDRRPAAAAVAVRVRFLHLQNRTPGVLTRRGLKTAACLNMSLCRP